MTGSPLPGKPRVTEALRPVSYTHLDVYKRQAQVLALEAIAAGHAEVIKIAVGKALGDGRKCLEPVFGHPDRGLSLIHIL